MTCEMPGCAGSVVPEKSVMLRVSCISVTPACACDTCGRLHWPGGGLVFNRQEHAAYLEDGVVVNRDMNGTEMSRLA